MANPGVDVKYIGDEPSFQNFAMLDELNQRIAISKAFNWYSYFYGNTEAKEFILTYSKSIGRTKDELNAIKALPDSAFNRQAGWIARMMNRGLEPNERLKTYFITHYKTLLASTKKIVVVDTTPSAPIVNVQQRIADKAAEHAGEIEGMLDDFMLDGCKTPFSVDAYLKSNNVTATVANKICEKFIPKAKEIATALTDKELAEGYTNFTKVQLKRYRDMLDAIVSECNAFSQQNKPIRKLRKKKEKSPEVLVAKMKYMKEQGLLKSIPPEKVIGANQLWVYNTKTKVLAVYHSDNAKGFTVKGSTLQNFDEKLSIGKRLRKPEKTLLTVLESGKIKLRKIMEELTTMQLNLTGRINDDTILLRVEK